MQNRRPMILFVTVFTTAVFGFLATALPLFAASKEKVLYSFCSASGCSDGAYPISNLIFDSAGNLYGTSGGGVNSGCGGNSCGTVFELIPGSNGTWTEKVLYRFTGGDDGNQPAAGLIFDSAGNLYGTTLGGGTSGTRCGGLGCGTVFELTPGTGGTWTEKVLHSFHDNYKDGYTPLAGLIFDTAGNLYGTTYYGGPFTTLCGSDHFCGTVFELTPGTGGTWTEKVLHSFKHNGKDGFNPRAGLILDAAGNLYGTTYFGGPPGRGCGGYGCGTVFELTRGTSHTWNEKVLHSFINNGKDGYNPEAGLIFDSAGNLYGTTLEGGFYGSGGCPSCGTVFELSPETNGKWKERVLHSFNDNGKDGFWPAAGLIFDAVGKLYSTTLDGGSTSGTGCNGWGCGTVFELTP